MPPATRQDKLCSQARIYEAAGGKRTTRRVRGAPRRTFQRTNMLVSADEVLQTPLKLLGVLMYPAVLEAALSLCGTEDAH
jgi:hypothetical protein